MAQCGVWFLLFEVARAGGSVRMTQCGGDVWAWLLERCGSWHAIKMTQCEVAQSDMAQCEMARYEV